MQRREFITLLGGSVFTWPLAARAQQRAIPRIGYIWSGTPGAELSIAGSRQGLTDRGYVVGGNLTIEERYAEGNPERIPALIAQLLALNIDVLVTPGTPITLAAQRDDDGTDRLHHRKSGRLGPSGQLVPSGRQYYRHVAALRRVQRKVVGVAYQGGPNVASYCCAVEPG